MVKKAAANEKINWHYPRLELAQSFISTLDAGLISSIVLFAPRRKGKTEFLLEDLKPVAEAAGYRWVYVSMWQDRSDPLATLCAALSKAAEPKGFSERVKGQLGRGFGLSSIQVEVPHMLQVKAVVDDKSKETHNQAQLQMLKPLMERLIKVSKGKVLLAIDEVQHLAKPEFHNFVAALRTELNENKASVKAVFTGSSRNRLQEMFCHIKAPLFQSGQTTDFPEMDDRFVAFMVNSFKLATGRKLDKKEAQEAFMLTGQTPGLFQQALANLMKLGGVDIISVAREVMADARMTSGYMERLGAMPPLDQLIMRRVAEGDSGTLYSSESRIALAAAMGLTDPLTTRQVQIAVDRLISEQIIYRVERGHYEIEDPQLRQWIKEAIDDEAPNPNVLKSGAKNKFLLGKS